jgi:ankyrin repeat protein
MANIPAQLHNLLQADNPTPNINKFNELITSNPECNLNEKFDGDTLLHCASMRAEFPFVSTLVNKRANIDIKNTHGYSPLHGAIYRCSIYYQFKDQFGEAQTIQTIQQFYHIIELLLKAGADANSEDQHGDTPLITICSYNHDQSIKLIMENIVCMLLNHRAKRERVSNDGGLTAEQVARRYLNDDIAVCIRDYVFDNECDESDV